MTVVSMNRSVDQLLTPTDVRQGKKRRIIYNYTKRAIDLLMTLAAAPILIVIIGMLALLIMTQGVKPFYSQPRVGKHGRVFKLWKLRSMVPNAEEVLEQFLSQNPDARVEWNSNQKLRHDPRVTPLGRVIRRYSLDELPQFINILAGQMSLVGPRPMFPEQLSLYDGSNYFSFRPGLTGLWQTCSRNSRAFGERAVQDTIYAGSISVAEDLRIIVRTVSVVFRGTGI